MLRLMVMGVLLPARVLGIGLGRGLHVAVKVPAILLRWIGKASLLLIAGILVLLLGLFLVVLVS